jgi:hypothetical protein
VGHMHGARQPVNRDDARGSSPCALKKNPTGGQEKMNGAEVAFDSKRCKKITKPIPAGTVKIARHISCHIARRR